MGLMRKIKESVTGQGDSPASLTCPACHDELRPTDIGEHGRVILDECPNCRGAWFDAGELDQLDGSPWANAEDQTFREVSADHPQANCPKCRVPLQAISPVEIEVTLDRCPACHGFWLDAGELDNMRELAAATDAQPDTVAGEHKPTGWSDLRWRMHLLQAHRRNSM